MMNIPSREVRNLATLFARIVDFKRHYTCRHSIGVAENAENMAKFYGFPEDKKTRFYLAGALHDIGKLMIPNEILQKPAKLTDEEYLVMKRHVIYTYQILSQIHSKGMDEVVRWASNHHEKINGEGYPNGLTAKNLSKEEQIMTCCDIYQALTEKRAYKAGFSHEKAMEIMREMVLHGDLDNSIVEDMDQVFGGIQPDEAKTYCNPYALNIRQMNLPHNPKPFAIKKARIQIMNSRFFILSW